MADSDLDAIRKRVESKRNKVAAAQAKRADVQQQVADELDTAHLLTEEARLDAELAAAQDASKVGNVREGNARNLDVAKAAMLAATGDSADTLPADGSTVEKPVGVDLETGELLSDKKAEVQYRENQQAAGLLPNADKPATSEGGK